MNKLLKILRIGFFDHQTDTAAQAHGQPRDERIIAPLAMIMLAGLTVVAIVFLTAFYVFVEDERAKKLQTARLLTQNRLTENLRDEAAAMEIGLDTMIDNERFVALFLAGDRDALYNASVPIYQHLNNRHQITHFYFTLPNRKIFLRVHKPDRYGDRLNRFTTQEAEKTGNPFSGIELGPLGTFTLRTVVPWNHNGELIGYLELGKEIDHIIAKIPDSVGSDILVRINKSLLDKSVWESKWTQSRQHSLRHWDHYPDVVLTGSSMATIPETLDQAIVARDRSSQPYDSFVVSGGAKQLRVSATPLLDASGTQVGDILTVLDTTLLNANFRRTMIIAIGFVLITVAVTFVFVFRRLKRIEHRFLRSWRELRQAQRNESLGYLTAGIAHNLNNLMFPIAILSETIVFDLPADSKITKDLKTIQMAAGRATKLIQQMTQFSRVGDLKRDRFPIAQCVRKALDLAQLTAPSSITYKEEIDDSAGDVFADVTLLESAFLNVLSNAVDAIEGKGGLITVTLSKIDLPDSQLELPDRLLPGPYAMCSIIDTGRGIDKETLEHIFDPFFTTKDVGMGTGLGLASAYGIIEIHGGAITVESTLGRGTIFTLNLPLTT